MDDDDYTKRAQDADAAFGRASSPTEEQQIADAELALTLLAGDRRSVLPREEAEGRAALARIIRASLPATLIRELLALAIDPKTPSTWPGMQPTRIVRFEEGRSLRWRRNGLIVLYVRGWLFAHDKALPEKNEAKRGTSLGHADAVMEKAYAAAAKKFNLSPVTIRDIWNKLTVSPWP